MCYYLAIRELFSGHTPRHKSGGCSGKNLKAVIMENASSATSKDDIDEFGRSNALRERYQGRSSQTPVACSRARGESVSSARSRGSACSPSVGTKRESDSASDRSAAPGRRAKSPRSMKDAATYADEVVEGSAAPARINGDQECPKQESSAIPDSSPSADCAQQAVGRNLQGPLSRDAPDWTGGADGGAGESVSSAHDEDLTRCCEYGNLFSEAAGLQCDLEVQVTMPGIVTGQMYNLGKVQEVRPATNFCLVHACYCVHMAAIFKTPNNDGEVWAWDAVRSLQEHLRDPSEAMIITMVEEAGADLEELCARYYERLELGLKRGRKWATQIPCDELAKTYRAVHDLGRARR